MSDDIQGIFDALLQPADYHARHDRARERCKRFRASRDRLESYFPHVFPGPLQREVTWGIVAAGLELARARASGGDEALRKQIDATVIDERFGHYQEALRRMLEWARTLIEGSIQGTVERVVLEAIVEAGPEFRLFRAVAGLLVVGIDNGLTPEELVRELAPIFREKVSVFPSRPEVTHRISGAQLGPGAPLQYTQNAVGFRAGEFGLREFQQSSRDPDVLYLLDEFLTLIEVNLKSARSRVILELYGPLTRERRQKLRARGTKANSQYPMEHIFHYDEEAGVLYVAAHTRLFEVWDVRAHRRLHHELLPDQSYLIHPVGPGRVRIAVRNSGLAEFDGKQLRALKRTALANVEFVAASPLEWNGYTVYTIRNGLLFADDSGEPGGVLEMPGRESDRVASVCLLPDEIVMTTWDRALHVFRGTGLPWKGWRGESRALDHFVCTAPDAPWGVVFDRHAETSAWAGPWSYGIVNDVRSVDEQPVRTAIVEQSGLIQSMPVPLAKGRLVIWNESHLTATMEVGNRRRINGRLGVQTLPPAYQETSVSRDGSLVAFHNWQSPCSLAVANTNGTIIARTEFPWVSRLVSIDPVHETLTLRGRKTTEDEQTTEERESRPQLSLWSWCWTNDSWTEVPAVFHGYRQGPRHGRDHVALYLNENRDLMFSGVAGLQCMVLEERPENEFIVVNDSVHVVNESSGETQVHPLRPLLYGRTLDEIQLEISTSRDRAWISEPGGVINGYSLHDANRLWRIRLPDTNPEEPAARMRLNCVDDLRDVITTRTKGGGTVAIDAETGELLLALVVQHEDPSDGFLPVITSESVLLPVSSEICAWQLSEEFRRRVSSRGV